MKKLKKRERIETYKRIALLFIALLISAVLYNLLILPLNLVVNGTSGIATITKYVYDIDPAIMMFLLYAFFTLISYMYLGREKTRVILLITIVYPILVKLTSPLSTIISTDNVDIIMLVLFAGIIGGVANGLIYKIGYNTGGTAVINQILYEKKNISITMTSFVISTSIVLLGSYIFGITNALYAVIYLYISKVISNKVLLGISDNKAFYIVTDQEDEIKDYIINVLKHDVTSFDAKGGLFDKQRKVLLTVIPTREYYKVSSVIKEIDKKAFFVVTDSYQVKGGK